jgi:hypothetical protein
LSVLAIEKFIERCHCVRVSFGIDVVMRKEDAGIDEDAHP